MTGNPICTLASLCSRDRLLRSMITQGLEALSHPPHFHSFHLNLEAVESFSQRSCGCFPEMALAYLNQIPFSKCLASQTQKLSPTLSPGSLSEPRCVPVTVLGIGTLCWARQFQLMPWGTHSLVGKLGEGSSYSLYIPLWLRLLGSWWPSGR